MWGLDLVEGLVPAAWGADHLVVAVDYFIKWIEARPLKKISDYEICARSGMVVKKDIGRQKGQVADRATPDPLGYQETIRGPTKETPFLLCYGSETISPVEIRFGSSMVLHHSAQQNEINRLIDLDLLEERRLEARMQMINYKQKAKEHHDKRVNPRTFSVGDLVLRNKAATCRKPKERKLWPKWEGPFFITRILHQGIYMLSEEDDTPITNPWHADHLKNYYV